MLSTRFAVLAALAGGAAFHNHALAQWTVTVLDVPTAFRTIVSSNGAASQAGYVAYDADPNSPTYAGFRNSTAGSWINLHPVGFTSSQALGVSGTRQVGTAFLPSGFGHAGVWSATAESWIDLHPPGATFSNAQGIRGTQQVGYAGFNSGVRAGLWNGTAASWLSLHPLGAINVTNSYAHAANGTQQVGEVEFSNFSQHASLWSGSAASWVDLHPAAATSSFCKAISGSQQVGTASILGQRHSSLWTGTAASWVDLNPAGSVFSEGIGTNGTFQVGNAIINDRYRASIWSGTAASWEDLSLALVGSWGDTNAWGVSNDATTLYVVGRGFNNTTGRDVALLWTRPYSAGTACDSIDFNHDGVSPDSGDIDDFLSVFGGGACSNDPNCGDIDFNNDGVSPDSDDVAALLRVFGGGAC